MASKWLRVAAVTLLCPPLFAQTQQLPAPPGRAIVNPRYQHIARAIDAILNSDPAFQRAHIGISVARLSDGAPVFFYDDQQFFVPASNTKLLTTTAGFALLGPDWKTRTTVESAAPPTSDGDLKGDLVLVGRGDPNLSGRVLPYDVHTERTEPPLKPLEALADQVVASGLKKVKGDVIGDDSWFAYERWGDSWGQDDLMWEFGAPVSALTVNDNEMFFTITPGKQIGEQAKVTANPLSNDYVIENHVITGAPRSQKQIAMDRQPGAYIIKVWGTIPQGSAPQGVGAGLAMEDPAAFAAEAFRNMLEARGVEVEGKSRAQHTNNALLPIPPELPNGAVTATPVQKPSAVPQPNPRVVLATLESHPLGDDLKVINKVSQNLHVEILMRQLGRERSLLPNTAAGGSVWGGTSVVRQFLTQTVGFTRDEFVYNDGSGMTPHNLVTPAALVKLLRWARTQPWANQFVDTLPLSGVDGTLEHRFLNTPTQGRVRAKTGSLSEVSALSGYATTIEGEELAFSVIVNTHNIQGVNRRLIDPIVRAIVETR
jgi:D-alanyl-D-alanine carboxypeptidase/D-alanyl-D-alanine-endopeptidase (penicillin-binding protein 4)